jgi:RNA polymerase subunit RPABC4/transcription elongation factor Spt4
MNNSNVPVQSLKTLAISIISAILLASFILIAVVGPAEYGIDPTGLGKALGLSVLAKPQQQQQQQQQFLQKNTKTAVSCPTGQQLADWLDVVIITVPPKSGLEYKFHVKETAELAYTWTTNGAKLHFDFHGEPSGDKTGYFKSFKETTDNKSKGILKAPFTGSHGWYWENKTQTPVQVTLKTKGQYTVIGLI